MSNTIFSAGPKGDWRVVSRPVKVGDYIRLKTSGGFSFSKAGDILLVSQVSGGLAKVKAKDHPRKAGDDPEYLWNYTSDEYEVVESATASATRGTTASGSWRVVSRTAKAGDYIRLKTNGNFSFNEPGDILRVHSMSGTMAKVKAKDHVRKAGDDPEYLWNYTSDEYEVVEPASGAKSATKSSGGIDLGGATLASLGLAGNTKPAAKTTAKAAAPTPTGEWRVVSRPVVAGDYIRLKTNGNFSFNEPGDILRVHLVSGTLAKVRAADHVRKAGDDPEYLWNYTSDEYEVVEPVSSAKTTAKAPTPTGSWRVVKRAAKAGDYIRLKTNGNFSFNEPGDILRVHRIDGTLAKVLASDHVRDTGREDSYEWNYTSDEYEVVEPVGAAPATKTTAKAAAPAGEWRVVSRAAKAGDYIRLKSSGGFSFSEAGDILLVHEMKGTMAKVKAKDHPREAGSDPEYLWNYLDSEYEVIERTTAAKPATKTTAKAAAPTGEWRVVKRAAKAGDYIRLKTNGNFSFNEPGDILLVHEISGGLAKVKAKDHVRKAGDDPEYLWNYTSDEYEVVEPVTASKPAAKTTAKAAAPADEWRVVKRAAKVGDYIRLTTTGGFTFNRQGDVLLVHTASEMLVGVLAADHPRPTGQEDDYVWNYTSDEYEVVEPVGAAPAKKTTAKTTSPLDGGLSVDIDLGAKGTGAKKSGSADKDFGADPVDKAPAAKKPLGGKKLGGKSPDAGAETCEIVNNALVAYRGKSGNVAIPEGVEVVKSGALPPKDVVKTIAFPASLKTIEIGALAQCTGIEKMAVAAGNTAFRMEGDCLCSADGATLIRYATGAPATALTVPDGVRKLEVGALAGAAIEELTLPASLETIGDVALFGCTALKRITLPVSLVDRLPAVLGRGTDGIDVCPVFADSDDFRFEGSRLMEYLGNERDVHIPEGVTAIDSEAFASEAKVVNVYIPASVTDIEEATFADLPYLAAIHVDEANPAYRSYNGALYTKDFSVLLQYPVANRNTSYNAPEGLLRVGMGAFYYCREVHYVNLGGVTEIGASAFLGCMHLFSLTATAATIDVGEDAFGECFKLERVEAPALMSKKDIVFPDSRV